MNSPELAISLATAFTFGCAAIYEMREHAPALTPPLIAIMLSLTMLAGLVALAENDAQGGLSHPNPPLQDRIDNPGL